MLACWTRCCFSSNKDELLTCLNSDFVWSNLIVQRRLCRVNFFQRAILCYKQMLKDVSVWSPSNLAKWKQPIWWQRSDCNEVCSSQIQSSFAWLQAFCYLYRLCVFAHDDSVASPLAENGPLVLSFAEYIFEVRYKPEKQYALVDALLLSPRCELAHITTFSSSIMDIIRVAYTTNIQCIYLLCALDSEEL